MRILSLIAVVVFLSALAAPARAGMVGDCNQESDWDLKIGGCTAVIRSGQYSGKYLNFAYNNRCYANNKVGRHNRAIEDCNQALRLDPGDASAYNNRGIAYHGLGKYRRAIEDYDQALRLYPGNAIAYHNRANARCRSGLVEAALDDRMQALRLGAFSTKDLQTYLRYRGFYNGTIDGDFGPISKRALRDWTVAGCPSE